VRSGPPTARFRDREYPGLGQGRTGVRCRHLLGLCPVRFRSPLRRGPDAATWPIAHDVSQRAEPDVRPLGHITSTFITDKMHRMSALLTGDVSSRHLMCPVHSAGRQRPDHTTGGVPVQSDSGWYDRTAARAMVIMTCTTPGKLLLHANSTQAAGVGAQGGCTRWLTLVAPGIPSVMSLGPHVGVRCLCTSPLEL
jgi:hypothetical protein